MSKYLYWCNECDWEETMNEHKYDFCPKCSHVNISRNNNLCGEWSETLSAWWFGANGCEFIAWKGSHEIAVFPCDNHPNLPTHFIKGDRRIETLEDFDYTLNNGKKYTCQYVLTEEL